MDRRVATGRASEVRINPKAKPLASRPANLLLTCHPDPSRDLLCQPVTPSVAKDLLCQLVILSAAKDLLSFRRPTPRVSFHPLAIRDNPQSEIVLYCSAREMNNDISSSPVGAAEFSPALQRWEGTIRRFKSRRDSPNFAHSQSATLIHGGHVSSFH